MTVTRKADLRELKLLHKQEKKLLQDMELKSLAAIDEQTRKFEQDNSVSWLSQLICVFPSHFQYTCL